MNNVGIITQARTGSTRLPGKVLLKAGGRTLLEHHVNRLRTSGHPVLLATTTLGEDDVLAALARDLGIAVWRGSEHDVLDRFDSCVAAFGLDTVVRVTSDCPLIDGAIVSRGVALWQQFSDPWVYLSNTVDRSFPRGMDFEIFSATALHAAAVSADRADEREHVTPYLWRRRDPRVRVEPLARRADRSDLRLTVDVAEDFELVRRLVEDHDAADASCDELIAILDGDPSLVALNASVEQKRV